MCIGLRRHSLSANNRQNIDLYWLKSKRAANRVHHWGTGKNFRDPQGVPGGYRAGTGGVPGGYRRGHQSNWWIGYTSLINGCGNQLLTNRSHGGRFNFRTVRLNWDRQKCFFFSFLGPSRSTRGTGLGPYRVHKSAIYFQKWDRFGTVPKNLALNWDRLAEKF